MIIIQIIIIKYKYLYGFMLQFFVKDGDMFSPVNLTATFSNTEYQLLSEGADGYERLI
jgi:hypothetical protein